MREKMARAMYETDVAALRAIAKYPDDVVATDFELWSEGYLRRVDAALDALMEPTAVMMDAGVAEGVQGHFGRSFVDMIRAAKQGESDGSSAVQGRD